MRRYETSLRAVNKTIFWSANDPVITEQSTGLLLSFFIFYNSFIFMMHEFMWFLNSMLKLKSFKSAYCLKLSNVNYDFIHRFEVIIFYFWLACLRNELWFGWA